MNKGKRTCRILKQIRKQIADANDIELVVEECQFKGDCSGTCPKCEAEVEYLEKKLEQRRLLGKAVTIAGVFVGLASITSCGDNIRMPNPEPLEGEVQAPVDTAFNRDTINSTNTKEVHTKVAPKNDKILP